MSSCPWSQTASGSLLCGRVTYEMIVGHGPTLYESGLPNTRRLELISAKPLRNGAVAMHYRRAC